MKIDWWIISQHLQSLFALLVIIAGPAACVAGFMIGEAWSGAAGVLFWIFAWFGVLAWSHG